MLVRSIEQVTIVQSIILQNKACDKKYRRKGLFSVVVDFTKKLINQNQHKLLLSRIQILAFFSLVKNLGPKAKENIFLLKKKKLILQNQNLNKVKRNKQKKAPLSIESPKNAGSTL